MSKPRSTPGLCHLASTRPPPGSGAASQPKRGIVPSTLLRLWERQCRSQAAGRSRHRSSQVSPIFFQAGGKSKPRSMPELRHLLCFFCGRGSASTRQPTSFSVSTRLFQAGKSLRKSKPRWTPGLLRKPMRGIVPSTLLVCVEVQPRGSPTRQAEGCFASSWVELRHLLCFVCGSGSASTQAAGSSHTSSQVSH